MNIGLTFETLVYLRGEVGVCFGRFPRPGQVRAGGPVSRFRLGRAGAGRLRGLRCCSVLRSATGMSLFHKGAAAPLVLGEGSTWASAQVGAVAGASASGAAVSSLRPGPVLIPVPAASVLVRASIDWLSVSQFHEGAPDFGGDFGMFFDRETGEVKRLTCRRETVKGSYSSGVTVRCYGGVLSVSGNPSRWNRRHSLFGVHDVAAGLAVFNSILSEHEVFAKARLPLFLSPQEVGQRWDEDLRRFVSVGEIEISRVDVCCSYSARSAEDARQLVRSLAQVRTRCGFPNVYADEAVAWNTLYHYVKYYCKGVEMELHARKTGVFDELAPLIEHLKSVGAVRHEVELRRRELLRRRLHTERLWRGVDLMTVLKDFEYVHRVSGGRIPLDSLPAEFEKLGYSPRQARRLYGVAQAYFAGADVLSGCSRASRFRLRADLLKVGIDPAAALDIARVPVHVRVIELGPLVIPRELARLR